MQATSRFLEGAVHRAPVRAALLLLVCLAIGSPGCGCGDDEGLLGVACSCAEAWVFQSSPVAPLPPNVTLVNLEQDSGTGTIGFGPTITTFPSVFMAASTRGTIVRIDVNTGVIVGEYRTSPQTVPFLSPSRTTVDKFGECWVGNRSDIFDTDTAHPGSVTRIGIVEGGTRYARSGPSGGPYTYTASATGEFLQGPFTYVSPSVVDRDGDGYIRTSYGLPNTSILDWDPLLSGGNDGGGVSLADDECIVNFTRVACSGTRGLAIDCDNDLWVGGTGNANWQEVSGATGVAGTIRSFGTAYGGAIDSSEVLWSVASPFWQHDINANTTSSSPNPGIYGIAIDPCTTRVWTSGNALRRWNPSPSATIAITTPWPGNFGHGLCADLNGDVWVAMGSAGVFRYNSAGTFLPPAITTPIVYAKGTAVDQNGKIWVADLLGDQAVRIDPAGPSVDLVVPMGAGAGPYNYSDMTGLAALSSCGETGYLIATHDALCAGTNWGRVSWQSIGTTPNGCTVTAEVRASDDPLNFPSTWTPVQNDTSFCGAPPVLGQYVQVRVTINRPPGCPPTCDPRLTSLRIECCDTADRPPNVQLNGPYVVIPPPNVTVPGTMGSPVSVQVTGTVTDPDGDPLTARWTIGGADAGPAVLGQGGATSITRDFPDGITTVALTATDGRNVVTDTTTVMIGDHIAPVVTCPSGPPVSGGRIVVRAFETTVPDLVAGTTATDNVTPPPALLISQSPVAGSLVQQGGTPIVVTATDGAGNSGTCGVLLQVDPVVAASSPARYQIFAPAAPILVSATYFVPAGEINDTTILVDGMVHTSVPGTLPGPVDVSPLAVGTHEIVIVCTNGALIVSRSDPLPIEVR